MKKFLGIAFAFALTTTLLLAVPGVFAGDPGSSQFDAMRVDGQTRYIQPQTWVWYYFDYNADRDKAKSRAEAWVDDGLNASSNFEAAKKVDLAIYSPDQMKDFALDSSIAPIGRGTKPPDGLAISSHDLYWAGNFNFNGRFFAVVKNSNDFPVQYRLWVQGASVTLYPVPTPTSLYPYLDNPLATPIPSATISGTLLLRENSGGNIYSVNGDGGNMKRLNYGLDPSFSPDGTMIAFTRWNEPVGLYVANADGSNEVRIWNGQQFMSPRWSPDGKRIAFAQNKLTRQVLPFGQDNIWKIGVLELNKQTDSDTTKNVLTEPQCTNHCFAPAWDPTGRYLVYADGAIGLMTTDTMTNSIWTMYNYTPKVQTPSYSPDGTQVVFQYAMHDHWEIATLNLADGTVTPLTSPDPLSFRLVNNVAPAWSPDSKQVIFLSDRHGKWEFYVVNTDGTNIRQVLQSVTNQLTIQYYFSNERVIDWIK